MHEGKDSTTVELEHFETRVKRLVYLLWLLQWFEEKAKDRSKLEAFILKARAEGHSWLPASVKELGRDLIGFVSCVSNAMLWTFYDEYNRAVHRGPVGVPHDGTEAIIRDCSKYQVRCHRAHTKVHVLRAIEDLRNRFIHAHIEGYTWLTDPMPPDQLLNFRVVVVRSGDDHESFPMVDRIGEDQEDLDKLVALHRRLAYMTFGELLEEVLVDCLRAYDIKVETMRKKSS